MAVSGDTLVVGASNEDSQAIQDAGAAYVFVRSGESWSQQAYLKASNTGAGDQFGWSVAMSGDTLVVGAPNEDSQVTGVNGNQSDNSADSAGAAYVFATTYNVSTATNGTGSGSVVLAPPGGAYGYGTLVMVTATADSGSSFMGWSGDLSGVTTPVTLTVDGDKNVIAVFSLKRYTIGVSANPAAGGNVSGGGTVALDPPGGTYGYGTVVTVTASADADFMFSGWSGDCTGIGACALTIDGNKRITATFSLKRYSVSTATSGAGSDTVSLDPPGGAYLQGTVVTAPQLSFRLAALHPFCSSDRAYPRARRPRTRFTTTTISAITNRMWTSPPPILATRPSAHRITRITAMIHSIGNISLCERCDSEYCRLRRSVQQSESHEYLPTNNLETGHGYWLIGVPPHPASFRPRHYLRLSITCCGLALASTASTGAIAPCRWLVRTPTPPGCRHVVVH